jgi:hypothetical protein
MLSNFSGHNRHAGHGVSGGHDALRPSAELAVVHRRMIGRDKNNIEVLYCSAVPVPNNIFRQ